MMTGREPVNVAIIGSGNIGTDVLIKALRSERLRPVWVAGIDPASDGLARAAQLGVNTTAGGLEALLPQLRRDDVRIVLDASSAAAHRRHAPLLAEAGAAVVDLTPAALGAACVPPVAPPALPEGGGPANISLVSCAGQAAIPIAAAIGQVQAVAYGEVVATVASRSVGPGTRQNIDEFTRTTAAGLEHIGGAAHGKTIVIINPAEPPILMRNTVHCLTADAPDRDAIGRAVDAMVVRVQGYVPGYRLSAAPVFDDRRVSVFLEVTGLGDYLPEYAGNLDIMTAAAVRAAELLAGGESGVAG